MIELKQLISQNESCSFQQLNKFEKQLKHLIIDYIPSQELYYKLKEIVPLDVLYNQKKSLMHIADKISRSLLKDFIEEIVYFSDDFEEKDAEDFEMIIYGMRGEEKEQSQKSFKKLTDQYGYNKIDEFLEIIQNKMKIQDKNINKTDNLQDKLVSQSEKSILLEEDNQKPQQKINQNEIGYEKITSVDNSQNQSLMSEKSKLNKFEKIQDFGETLKNFIASYITQCIIDNKDSPCYICNNLNLNNHLQFMNQQSTLQESIKQCIFDHKNTTSKYQKILKSQVLQQIFLNTSLNKTYTNFVKNDQSFFQKDSFQDNGKDQSKFVLFTDIFYNLKEIQQLFEPFLLQNQQDKNKIFSDYILNQVDMKDVEQILDIRINYQHTLGITKGDPNAQQYQKCLLIQKNNNLFDQNKFNYKKFDGYDNFDKNNLGNQKLPLGLFNQRQNDFKSCFCPPQNEQNQISQPGSFKITQQILEKQQQNVYNHNQKQQTSVFSQQKLQPIQHKNNLQQDNLFSNSNVNGFFKQQNLQKKEEQIDQQQQTPISENNQPKQFQNNNIFSQQLNQQTQNTDFSQFQQNQGNKLPQKNLDFTLKQQPLKFEIQKPLQQFPKPDVQNCIFRTSEIFGESKLNNKKELKKNDKISFFARSEFEFNPQTQQDKKELNENYKESKDHLQKFLKNNQTEESFQNISEKEKQNQQQDSIQSLHDFQVRRNIFEKQPVSEQSSFFSNKLSFKQFNIQNLIYLQIWLILQTKKIQ